MKTTGNRLGMAIMVLSACGLARGGQIDQRATAWATPQTRQRLAHVSDAAQTAVTITLDERSPMGLPAEAFVAAQGPDGVFTGDLMGIAGISFRLVTDGRDLRGASLWLRSAASGRIWISHRVAWTKDPTQGVVNVVPLDRLAGGWGAGGADPALDAQWAEDLKTVDLLGVRVTQRGSAAVACGISDFMLVSQAGETETLPLGRLDAALWARFGVLTPGAVNPEQAAADADQDGMSDVNELVVGTNPDDAASIFAVRIASAAGGTIVQWPCVADGVYCLSRAGALDQTFEAVPGARALRPTADEVASGTMTYTEAFAGETGRTYFYKVHKE